MEYNGCPDSEVLAEYFRKWKYDPKRKEEVLNKLHFNQQTSTKQNSLKEQILELFQKHYDRNAGQTYLGCSNEERYKLIAQSFNDCLMDIYTLVKDYEGE
jgi:hypothetical protein